MEELRPSKFPMGVVPAQRQVHVPVNGQTPVRQPVPHTYSSVSGTQGPLCSVPEIQSTAAYSGILDARIAHAAPLLASTGVDAAALEQQHLQQTQQDQHAIDIFLANGQASPVPPAELGQTNAAAGGGKPTDNLLAAACPQHSDTSQQTVPTFGTIESGNVSQSPQLAAACQELAAVAVAHAQQRSELQQLLQAQSTATAIPQSNANSSSIATVRLPTPMQRPAVVKAGYKLTQSAVLREDSTRYSVADTAAWPPAPSRQKSAPGQQPRKALAPVCNKLQPQHQVLNLTSASAAASKSLNMAQHDSCVVQQAAISTSSGANAAVLPSEASVGLWLTTPSGSDQVGNVAAADTSPEAGFSSQPSFGTVHAMLLSLQLPGGGAMPGQGQHDPLVSASGLEHALQPPTSNSQQLVVCSLDHARPGSVIPSSPEAHADHMQGRAPCMFAACGQECFAACTCPCTVRTNRVSSNALLSCKGSTC